MMNEHGCNKIFFGCGVRASTILLDMSVKK